MSDDKPTASAVNRISITDVVKDANGTPAAIALDEQQLSVNDPGRADGRGTAIRRSGQRAAHLT